MKITSGLLLQARDYLYQVIIDENLKFGAKFNSIDPDSITPFLQSLEIVSESLKFERTNYKDINPTELTTVIFTKFIYLTKLPWIKSAWRGRNHVLNAMTPELFSCLEQCELCSETDQANEWWENLMDYSRSLNQETKTEIGREGEKLSFQYEFDRVGREPKREYINNSTAGYDLLSWESHNSNKRIMIEVKSSKKGLSSAQAYISRNEWQTAVENEENFFFHFWLLTNKQLKVVPAKDVIETSPINENAGEWQSFRLDFQHFF